MSIFNNPLKNPPVNPNKESNKPTKPKLAIKRAEMPTINLTPIFEPLIMASMTLLSRLRSSLIFVPNVSGLASSGSNILENTNVFYAHDRFIFIKMYNKSKKLLDEFLKLKNLDNKNKCIEL